MEGIFIHTKIARDIRDFALSLNCEFHQIPIESSFSRYIEFLEHRRLEEYYNLK
jgi:NH3-dependent NAD+ synthetase